MFNKRNIITLLIIIVSLLLIGVSNYFFADSSYHFIINPETNERMGRYWVGDIDGVLMAIALCVVVIALWIPAARFGWIDKFVKCLINKALYYKQHIAENKKKYLFYVCMLCLIPVIALAIDYVFSFFTPRIFGHTIRRVTFFTTVGLSIYSIIIFRGKPEKLFVSLSLIIGFLYVITHPLLFFGFDNEVHYAWIVEESYIRNVSVVESDYVLARTLQTEYFGWLPSGESNAVVYSFPKGEGTLAWTGQYGLRMLYSRLTHIPMGLILYFGRSLALHPNIILWMIMYGSHLLYTFIVYLALRRLNSGKYLMAAIAMVPLTFLVSASVGYDGWMKAFLLLGFAYYFYQLQTPDKKVKPKDMIIMFSAFLLGLAPRVVYFPLLLILYNMRKDKFKTDKGYKCYLAAVTGAIIFVIGSFVIPYYTTTGVSMDDPRGDNNVSIAGQIMFILQNPLVYSRILLTFLKDYLNIFLSNNFITCYISYEHLSFPNLTILLILAVALTDRCVQDKFTSSVWLKLFVILVFFSTIALFTTSMYIGFTDVGASYILGVQRRYLIPLLFPFLYVICNFKFMSKANNAADAFINRFGVEKILNRAPYSMFVFGIMSLVLFSGAWNTFLFL